MAQLVTIRDVAEKAGASISAVSYALNRRPGMVNAKKRERILAVAREMGYRPSRQARQMRRQANMTLAVQFDSAAVSDNVWRSSMAQSWLTLRGISECTAARGYHLHLLTTGSEQDCDRFEQQVLRENAVDGVVFMGFSQRDVAKQWVPRLLEQMDSLAMPAVGIDEMLADQGVPLVAVNLEPAVQQAAKRMRELGHRKVAYVGVGYPLVSERQSRLTLFRDALDQLGVSLPDEWIVPTRIEIDGYRHTRQLLDAGHRPDCILYSGDHLAMAGIQAILDCGLRVPGDISVLGMDHAPYSAASPIGLASLEKHFYDHGWTLAKLLCDQIENAQDAQVPARTALDARFVDGPSLGQAGQQ